MNWSPSRDHQGFESIPYFIRRKHGSIRWEATCKRIVPIWSVGSISRTVIGGFDSLETAKAACEAHSQGRPIPTETEKRCVMCHVLKPQTAFRRNRHVVRDGTRHACSECLRKYDSENRKRRNGG